MPEREVWRIFHPLGKTMRSSSELESFLSTNNVFAKRLHAAGITMLPSNAVTEHDLTAPHRAALERILVDHRHIGVDNDGSIVVVTPEKVAGPHELAFTRFCNGKEFAGVTMPSIHPDFLDAGTLVTFFEADTYTTDRYGEVSQSFTDIAEAHKGFQAAATLYAKQHNLRPSSTEAAHWTLSRSVGWPILNRMRDPCVSSPVATVKTALQLASFLTPTSTDIGWAHDNIHGDRCMRHTGHFTDGKLHFTQLVLHTRPLAQYYDLLRAWGHMLLLSEDPCDLVKIIHEKIASFCQDDPENAKRIRALWRMRCTGIINDILKSPSRVNNHRFRENLRVLKVIVNSK